MTSNWGSVDLSWIPGGLGWWLSGMGNAPSAPVGRVGRVAIKGWANEESYTILVPLYVGDTA